MRASVLGEELSGGLHPLCARRRMACFRCNRRNRWRFAPATALKSGEIPIDDAHQVQRERQRRAIRSACLHEKEAHAHTRRDGDAPSRGWSLETLRLLCDRVAKREHSNAPSSSSITSYGSHRFAGKRRTNHALDDDTQAHIKIPDVAKDRQLLF